MEMPEDYVRIQYADGFYLGQVAEDGKTEHGHGMFSWDNGNIYTGEFRNGRFNGHGRYAWADGRIYDGDFLVIIGSDWNPNKGSASSSSRSSAASSDTSSPVAGTSEAL